MSAKHFYTSTGSVYANGRDEPEQFAFNVSLESGLLTASFWMTESELLELRDTIDNAIDHRQAMRVAA